MPNIFADEVRAVWASVQEKHTALNERSSKTRLCVRQDPEQQRLAGQIRTRLLWLRTFDPTNAATYEQNLAIVAADPADEKPHLRVVA